MKTFKLSFFTALIALCHAPQAQTVTGNDFLKLSLDYQYIYMKYKEPGVMSETGQFPGVKGQVRLNVYQKFDISLGGSYFDGNLYYRGATFSGVPVTQTTVDFVRDYRLLVHADFVNWELASGYANRYWHNDLVISYTRNTEYKYIPIIFKYSPTPYYLSFEYRLWIEGKNISTMSTVDPAARDVEFTQSSGEGFAFEAGVQYPFGPLEAKVYIAYDYWSVADSDIQNDNTQNLIEPRNNTSTYIFGVGFIY